MPRSNRYSGPWPPGLVVVVTAALLLALTRPASANVLDVEPAADEINVGTTTTIVVETDIPGRSVTASVDPTSEGDVAFVQADGSTAPEVQVVTTAFGYEETGTATISVQGTAAGDVTILLVEAETGEALTASLSVIEAAPPAPAPGFTVEVPAGGLAITEFEGTLAEFEAATGVHTCAMTVVGSFVTYVYGAPAFVNAQFLASFESPQLLICRGR